MKTFVIGAIALALSGVAAAEPARHPFAVRVEHLVKQFIGPPKGAPFDEFDARDKERARSYLSGVKDASVGLTWCYPGDLKPDELDWIIVAELQKLPVEAQRGMAAPPILKVLQSKFPCVGAKP